MIRRHFVQLPIPIFLVFAATQVSFVSYFLDLSRMVLLLYNDRGSCWHWRLSWCWRRRHENAITIQSVDMVVCMMNPRGLMRDAKSATALPRQMVVAKTTRPSHPTSRPPSFPALSASLVIALATSFTTTMTAVAAAATFAVSPTVG